MTSTYAETWALIRALWDTWEPTDAIASLCLQRWGSLRQDHLQEAVRLHRMEASGQYREPKVHRIMDIYAERTTTAYAAERRAAGPVAAERPMPPQEQEDFEAWAAKVIESATAAELEAARSMLGGSLKRRTFVACAVDRLRSKSGEARFRGRLVPVEHL